MKIDRQSTKLLRNEKQAISHAIGCQARLCSATAKLVDDLLNHISIVIFQVMFHYVFNVIQRCITVAEGDRLVLIDF